MIRSLIEAAAGRAPFDLCIRNVRIVNVFDESVRLGAIGVVGGRIAYVGEDEGLWTLENVDGGGMYALPGFVDAHMHLESSMLAPKAFARVALSCGTTTVCADPHEVCNVMGMEGVKRLLECAEGSKLRILMMAPSTIPSAPGFEGTGYAVGAEEMRRMLADGAFYGLGEVMDFNGVAAGEEPIVSVLEEAAKSGCVMDGHASLLTGRGLMAFRAAGIDSDHTLRTPEKLREELALGFCAQVQEMGLSPEMVRAMNEAPVQDRICLVTDDVPLPRLMERGHLNHVAAKAIAMGLSPMRAIRYATINPAQRLRLYDVGGIAPGMRADIQLVRNLENLSAERVWFEGEQVFPCAEQESAARKKAFAAMRGTVRLARPVSLKDLMIPLPQGDWKKGDTAYANIIHQDGRTSRTERVRAALRLTQGQGGLVPDTAGYLKMAVFNRYGKDQHGLALIDGLAGFSGAVALTYGHDAHNLAVYGTSDEDMLLAASAVAEAGGGICFAKDGAVRTLIELPLAGLMSEMEPEALYGALKEFLAQIREAGFVHSDPMVFLTLMPLAVSPAIKCTDLGLIDVAGKRMLPLIEEVVKEGREA